jgi:hypothetical protein
VATSSLKATSLCYAFFNSKYENKAAELSPLFARSTAKKMHFDVYECYFRILFFILWL